MTQLELAVYGKGGIGKSTLSANLSAAIAQAGYRVLQVGCDPKHDSTRLLVHGEPQVAVLDYIRSGGAENATGLPDGNAAETATVPTGGADIPAYISGNKALNTLVKTGAYGVLCVEAGGPKPGIGCAGRGIITAFDFLEKQKIKEHCDVILYDVLGDVVCGGFAVPVRREYADSILLVTSGEFMAVYAANNILRGIRNFDGDRRCRVAGILYNERRVPDEDERVRRFAEAVGLPILKKVPRHEDFASAERAHMTLMEMPEGDPALKALFRELAVYLTNDPALYPAKPLSDEDLEAVVLGGAGVGTETPADGGVSPDSLSTNSSVAAADMGSAGAGPSQARTHKPPLYGCAFNGAATQAIHLTDARVIAHAPKGCSFYTWQNISSPGRKNLFNRGVLLPSSVAPHFVSTDMSEAEAVFGGLDRLREEVRKALDDGCPAVVVLSSCVSGIIGDDIKALEEMSTPDQTVIAVAADGVIAGDYMEGLRMSIREIGEHLIDRSVRPAGRSINLIHEAGIAIDKDENFRRLKEMLEPLGIGINCRFLGDATVGEVRGLLKAPLNVLASDDEDSRRVRAWLEMDYGCRFMEEPLPVGVKATERWLRDLAGFFEIKDNAVMNTVLERERARYEAEVRRLRPALEGKRIFITTINTNLDWLLTVIDDLGMEIVRIGVLNYLRTEVRVSETPGRYPIDENFPWGEAEDEIRAADPDIALFNYTPQIKGSRSVIDSLPMLPRIGFDSGLAVAERWAELLAHTIEGGWRQDRELYERYYR